MRGVTPPDRKYGFRTMRVGSVVEIDTADVVAFGQSYRLRPPFLEAAHEARPRKFRLICLESDNGVTFLAKRTS